ncbi:MAG: hypothetical protein HY343_03000 [Lentisphaerae bacterium]|nr:hypothetical protein [Lentisphaerota bacterium]
MQVFNNVSAYAVWKSYNSNVTSLRQSMSKLSSGTRIAQAGDDPAGLAMSERLRAQYRNSSVAALNIENNVNFLQTADSWAQKIQDILGRMAELSIMANDSTKATVDRNNLQREFEQMQKEIQRITSGATAAAKFNGLYLFRGGSGVAMLTQDGVQGGKISIQIGPDSNQIFTEETMNLTNSNFAIIGSYAKYSYGTVNMTALGSTFYRVKWASIICGAQLSISVQSYAQAAVDKLNLGIDYISSLRAIIGGEMNRMNQTLSGLRNYEENSRAAESRIRDVDVAWESTQLSKYQILTQLGTSMLAQANALPNSVLGLIQR